MKRLTLFMQEAKVLVMFPTNCMKFANSATESFAGEWNGSAGGCN